MVIKNGDTVVYKNISGRKYAWDLVHLGVYTIIGQANDSGGYKFFKVRHNNGAETSWYHEDDFISLSKLRSMKLEKLKDVKL